MVYVTYWWRHTSSWRPAWRCFWLCWRRICLAMRCVTALMSLHVIVGEEQVVDEGFGRSLSCALMPTPWCAAPPCPRDSSVDCRLPRRSALNGMAQRGCMQFDLRQGLGIAGHQPDVAADVFRSTAQVADNRRGEGVVADLDRWFLTICAQYRARDDETAANSMAARVTSCFAGIPL